MTDFSNPDRHIELAPDDVRTLLDALNRADADLARDLKVCDTLESNGVDASDMRQEALGARERFDKMRVKLITASHPGAVGDVLTASQTIRVPKVPDIPSARPGPTSNALVTV